MKKLPLILLILCLAGAAAWWFWPRDTDVMRLSGVVEIQEVRLSSKNGGRVYEIFVKEGQLVEPGQKLLAFDAPEWVAQRDQWEARLRAAEAEWERSKTGRPEEVRGAEASLAVAQARYDRLKNNPWRPEERRQAKSDLQAAEAEFKEAEENFVRVTELYRTRSISKGEFDLALSARDRTRARADSARAKHEMVTEGARKEDLAEAKAELDKAQARYDELYAGARIEEQKLAEAKVKEARAKLAEAEVYVKESLLCAPEKLGRARVEVVAFRPGDVVPPNMPSVRVLRLDDWWVKVFVPETKLGHIKPDMDVEVYIDTYPGRTFKGRVAQIAHISEFTPRNVQSLDERRHQVFAVKIEVLNPEGRFHAGMAAEVVVPLQ